MAKMNNKKDTSERILDSAETLFAKKGFEGTSTREIAEKAGISIQTLHYHCGGKQKLYSAVLERTVVPVTGMINRHVQEMLKRDLNNDQVLEDCIGGLVDELFETLNKNPNYALLFYRQWLEADSELRRVEWERLVPYLRNWNQKVENIVDEDRRSGIDIPMTFLSLSVVYWGLFVQPEFTGKILGQNPDSPQYLDRLKAHAKNMTKRMLSRAD